MRHFSFQILISKLINILIEYEYEQIVNNNDRRLKRARAKRREVEKREVELQLLRRALTQKQDKSNEIDDVQIRYHVLLLILQRSV